jgi:hypothetical protein
MGAEDTLFVLLERRGTQLAMHPLVIDLDNQHRQPAFELR